jgi:two-component system nitrogen regulation response regulator GlnG
VRQLQNCVRAAVYQSVGHTLLPGDLPGPITTEAVPGAVPAAGASDRTTVIDIAAVIESLLEQGGGVHDRVIALVERELITRALRRTHGHQAQASELLGINRTTLRTKLRDLGITLDKVVTEQAGD